MATIQVEKTMPIHLSKLRLKNQQFPLFLIYHKRKKEWLEKDGKRFSGTEHIEFAKKFVSVDLAIEIVQELAGNGHNGKDTLEDYAIVRLEVAVKEAYDVVE